MTSRFGYRVADFKVRIISSILCVQTERENNSKEENFVQWWTRSRRWTYLPHSDTDMSHTSIQHGEMGWPGGEILWPDPGPVPVWSWHGPWMMGLNVGVFRFFPWSKYQTIIETNKLVHLTRKIRAMICLHDSSEIIARTQLWFVYIFPVVKRRRFFNAFYIFHVYSI